jgi:hypothetical protein
MCRPTLELATFGNSWQLDPSLAAEMHSRCMRATWPDTTLSMVLEATRENFVSPRVQVVRATVPQEHFIGFVLDELPVRPKGAK